MYEGTRKAAGVVLATFGTFLAFLQAFSQAQFPGEGPTKTIEWEGIVTDPFLTILRDDVWQARLDFPSVGDPLSGTVVANRVQQSMELHIPGWTVTAGSASTADVEQFPYSAGGYAPVSSTAYGPGPAHIPVEFESWGAVVNEDGTGHFALRPLQMSADSRYTQHGYNVGLEVDVTRAIVDGVELFPLPPPPYEPEPSLVEVVATGEVVKYRVGTEPFPDGVELPVEVGMPSGAAWQYYPKLGRTDIAVPPIAMWAGDDFEVTQEGKFVSVASSNASWVGQDGPLLTDGRPLRSLSLYTQVFAADGKSMSPIGDFEWDAENIKEAKAFLSVEDSTKESYLPWTRTTVSMEFASLESHEYFAGDANKDQVFDQHDLIQLLQSGKYATGDAAIWSDGDFNGDGVFDQFDIIQAQKDMPYLAGGTNALAAVPEPGSWALLLMAIAGVIAAARPTHHRRSAAGIR